MIEKTDTRLLISPDEVVKICDRAGTIDSIDIAKDIEDAFLELNSTKSESDKKWLYYKLLATIYDGGRMQGIREMRNRQKGALQ